MTHEALWFDLFYLKTISNDKLNLISYFKYYTKYAVNEFNKTRFSLQKPVTESFQPSLTQRRVGMKLNSQTLIPRSLLKNW